MQKPNNNVKRKKDIIKLLFIMLLSYSAIWVLFLNRHFYYSADEKKCVTFWKTLGGNCFIIPYKYYNIFRPSKNFIRTPNDNCITIIWDEKLPEYDFVLINQTGEEVFTNLPDYKVKYYNIEDRENFKGLDSSYFYNKDTSYFKNCVTVDIFDFREL